MNVIHTDNTQELADFRANELSADRLLNLIPNAQRALHVNPTVGIGKSTAIDNLIDKAITSGRYDLVVVLAPTHGILKERRLLKHRNSAIKYKYLKKRPSQMCGKTRDSKWKIFEQHHMSLLAKQELCQECPKLKKCFWPKQISMDVKGIGVIFAPQAYMNIMPTFIRHLQHMSGAERVLVIMDEIDFSRNPIRKHITSANIQNHISILKAILADAKEEDRHKHAKTIAQLEQLLNSKGRTVRIDPKSLTVPIGLSLEIQKRGWDAFGEDFYYIGFDLEMCGYSSGKSRQFDPDGSVSFSALPWLGKETIIFSGTACVELLAYRLGRDIVQAFPGYVFQHRQTTWYNLVSSSGMAKYFTRHVSRLLDFFAHLSLKRHSEGKRVLLICKKDYRDRCIEKLNARLRKLSKNKLSVVTADAWIKASPSKRRTLIPLLHYGIIGVNDFEDFDCAYCIMGYYLPNNYISDYFQEPNPAKRQLSISIQTSVNPPYRIVLPEHPGDAIYREYLNLGQQVISQEEVGAVIQAVGRVRPFTNAREIITIQCGVFNNVRGVETVTTLEELRSRLSIQSSRQLNTAEISHRVQSLQEQGYTQKEISQQTGLSRRTVQRHWNKFRKAS